MALNMSNHWENASQRDRSSYIASAGVAVPTSGGKDAEKKEWTLWAGL